MKTITKTLNLTKSAKKSNLKVYLLSGAILSLIPLGVVIAKVVFHVDMNIE